MSERLDFLKGGRDLDARQQTLRATIDWSFGLLSAEEKTLFAALSVFRRGWSLAAAERVCDADVEMLQSLLDKSLINRADGRFAMLETIREHGAESLERSGKLPAMTERHARYFLELVQSPTSYAPAFYFGDDWMRTCALERDNFRATLEWFGTTNAARELQVLVLALWLYWLKVGARTEGELWINRVLDLAADDPTYRRADLLAFLGEFPRYAGHPAEALEIKKRALELATPDSGVYPALLADMASLGAAVGDLPNAAAWATEALQIREAGGPRDGVGHALVAKGEVALASGQYEEAEALLRGAYDIAREENDTLQSLETGCFLAEAMRRQGRPDEARQLFADVAERALVLDFHPALISALLGLARAIADTHPKRAAELTGAIEELSTTTSARPYYAVGNVAELREMLTDRLSESELTASLAAGRRRAVGDLLL